MTVQRQVNLKQQSDSVFFLFVFIFRFGQSSLTISKFVPHICKLLADPNSQVRGSF